MSLAETLRHDYVPHRTKPDGRPPSSAVGAVREGAMGSRLYIGGISHDTTENTLRGWFSDHGLSVQAVHIVLNQATGIGRGFAFAYFDDCNAAHNAMDVLAGFFLDGRLPKFQTVPLLYSPV